MDVTVPKNLVPVDEDGVERRGVSVSVIVCPERSVPTMSTVPGVSAPPTTVRVIVTWRAVLASGMTPAFAIGA